MLDAEICGGLSRLDVVLVLFVLFVGLGKEGLVSSLGETGFLIKQGENSEFILLLFIKKEEEKKVMEKKIRIVQPRREQKGEERNLEEEEEES